MDDDTSNLDQQLHGDIDSKSARMSTTSDDICDDPLPHDPG